MSIKNSLIHKNSIEILKNLKYNVNIELCSIKGLIDIDGDISLHNCVLYDGFNYTGSSRSSFVRELRNKIFHWDTDLKEGQELGSEEIVKL